METKEVRVYGIDMNKDTSSVGMGEWDSISDELWMSIAESHGLVWSLGGFQKDFNREKIDCDLYDMYIRFI